MGGALLALTALLATLLVVGYLTRSRATSDFSVAVRPVSSRSAAAAVCGEFLSAVLFLGSSGIVLASGVRGAWFFSGIALGYVLLATLVIAPLRRSGAYSPSDFAEWRLGSRVARRIVTASVVLASVLYLLVQYVAAGMLTRELTHVPEWGAWGALLVLTLSVVLGSAGGSSTGFQALHFWFKLVAIGLPALVLAGVWWGHGGDTGTMSGPPVFHESMGVDIDQGQHVVVSESTLVRVEGRINGVAYTGEDGAVVLEPGMYEVEGGTRMSFAEGAPVPHRSFLPVLDTGEWNGVHMGPFTWDGYSIYLALVLGVIGLPQFVARFYGTTGPRSARRTLILVLALLSVFSVAPILLGGLGRVHTPDLLVTGRLDLLPLELPKRLLPGSTGMVLTALLAAGAAAAVVTASVALTSAVAGMIAQCAGAGDRRAFWGGAVLALGLPLALIALVPEVTELGLNVLALVAFQVSAVTVAPLLLLGIWWRGLTDVGAASGVLFGMAGTALCVSAGALGWTTDVEGGAVALAPTLFLFPLTLAVMVTVSWCTRHRVPADVDEKLARMHLPGHAS